MGATGMRMKHGQGNLQPGHVQDVEAVVPIDSYEPGEIDYYLRNVTHYLTGLDRPLESGAEIDGPGESNLTWITETLKDGTVEPPRRVLRLSPKADQKQIQNALSGVGKS